MSEALQQLRQQIDSVDEQLLQLLSQRALLAQRVGHVKGGAVVYRPEREAQVLQRMADLNPGPLPEARVRFLFREIMSACLALEQPLKIAYLGPAGTFTESAARKAFGDSPQYLPQPNFDEAVRAVEAGQADYCVIPVENSTEGAVGRTLDLLLETRLVICGEVTLRIHQNLLRSQNSLAGIQTIYSHAQSLGQCQQWLNRHLPGVARIAVASNAEAARLAATDPNSAAIAGVAAAQLYGLEVLAPSIEDEPNNTTRFITLGHHTSGPSGNDKTSLVCSANNQPGAVFALLEPLARYGVSMSKLESRPAGKGLWEYVFYIDFEGHQHDTKVAHALDELKQRAGFVKILGSYPRNVTPCE